jgi:hypothetical protein
MDKVLQYLKSKTVLFGLLLAVVSWAQTLVVNAPLSPELQGYVGTVIAAVVVWLRTQTTKPLSEK